MMPPADSNLSLTDDEKALLQRWVAEGAEYRPHWSLAPVVSRPPPVLRGGSTPDNPIDTFVRARLADDGLSPAPRAPSDVLIRRLAFDLTGLPPTPDEIDAFLADRSPGAYERLVDGYLGSPAYGERMAMDWLDLARYADTYGYQNDVERDMSPYRDWVIHAFNQNLPYDQFLTWQLAGDLLPNATREQRVATAFNRLHRQTNEGGSIDEEFRTEYVVDRVNTFGTSMLGLTVECARCHDHRFDPITQRDYYSLFAFFNNIDESGLYSHFTNATPSPSLLLWPPAKEQEHARLSAQVRAIEAQLQQMSRSARPAFRSQPKNAGITLPAPIAHLAFDRVDWRDDAGQRREAGCATERWAGPGERRPSIQWRQLGDPSRRQDVRAHRSVLAGAAPPAHRTAGARRRPAPVARVVRRRQPRLRADARSRSSVRRPHSLLAGQRDRRPRPAAVAGQCLVPTGRDLRRLQPGGWHPALLERRAARRPTSFAIGCTRTSPTAVPRATTSRSSPA